MEFNMVMAYADGASVRGTPGLFMPADKARVDYLWRKINALDNSALSFDGDVQGHILQDTVGNCTAFLTVDGLDDIKTQIELISSRLDRLDDTADFIDSINDRLDRIDENSDAIAVLGERLNDCAASIDSVAEEQLAYFKIADFSTVDGSLVFFDGIGDTKFTLGGATWDTVAAQ